MLQQTTIQAVTPAFERFYKALSSVHALARSTDEDLRPLVAGLGYYRRFKWMREGSIQLTEKSGNSASIDWPGSAAEWLQIKGVGLYTSAAISSITNGEAVGVVDGNVERVASRLFCWPYSSGDKTLKALSQSWMNKLVEDKNPGRINEAIMELGQTICRPLVPKCVDCPINGSCLSYKRRLTPYFPKAKPKLLKESLGLALLCLVDESSYFLKNRSSEAKFLKNHPGFITYLQETEGHWKPDSHPISFPEGAVLLGNFRHAITKYQFNVSVYKSSAVQLLDQELTPVANLDKSLGTNLDRKALRFLLK